MRKLIPLAASAAIMLISFILTTPSGEFIVSLPWQAFLTLFMISIAAAGLRRENAYAPLETFAASLEYTVSAIGAMTLFAFITAPFLTAPYSAIAFTAISDRVLEKTEKERYANASAALVSAAAYSGSMLLPAGSAQNLIISSGYGVSAIDTMYPAFLISIPVMALVLIIILGRNLLRDRIYMHAKASDDTGSRSLRMFYICLLLVVALSASKLFFWFDVLIVFLAVVIVFDRKVFLKADYIMLASFMLVITAAESFASSGFLEPVIREGMASHPVLLPYILSAFLSPSVASVMLDSAAQHPDTLLLLVNLGGMAFLSSASAIPLLLRRKSPAAMLRIAIGTAISLSALGILFLLKDLPV